LRAAGIVRFSLSGVGRTAVPTASVWNAIDYNNAADFPQRELREFLRPARSPQQPATYNKKLRT